MCAGRQWGRQEGQGRIFPSRGSNNIFIKINLLPAFQASFFVAAFYHRALHDAVAYAPSELNILQLRSSERLSPCQGGQG